MRYQDKKRIARKNMKRMKKSVILFSLPILLLLTGCKGLETGEKYDVRQEEQGIQGKPEEAENQNEQGNIAGEGRQDGQSGAKQQPIDEGQEQQELSASDNDSAGIVERQQEENKGEDGIQDEGLDSGDAGLDGGAADEKKSRPEGWELEFASEDWGLSFGEPGTQPVGNASAEDLAWYDAYFVGGDEEKVIYLTFDCGYENGNTEPILDALKKHNAKGTFFVVGHFLETAPDLVKRMTEEGHAVGNHTYHHLDMPTISDMADFRKEMDDVADLFREITGKELSPYYRPPQGKCNTANLEKAQELGYCTIFWSLAYVDWDADNQPSHEEAFSKLTSRVHPGAIVLLHNTSRTNGEILDELLTKWEGMGYSFRPLSELTGK